MGQVREGGRSKNDQGLNLIKDDCSDINKNRNNEVFVIQPHPFPLMCTFSFGHEFSIYLLSITFAKVSRLQLSSGLS